MKILGTKTENTRQYIAGFKFKKVGVYADSKYEADTLARAYFKPNKKDSSLLWVELADTPIDTSTL